MTDGVKSRGRFAVCGCEPGISCVKTMLFEKITGKRYSVCST